MINAMTTVEHKDEIYHFFFIYLQIRYKVQFTAIFIFFFFLMFEIVFTIKYYTYLKNLRYSYRLITSVNIYTIYNIS